MAGMFEVSNSVSGLISITDQYKNYHLRKSGVLYRSDFASGGIYDAFVAKIPVAGMVSPIVVLRPRGIQSSATPAFNSVTQEIYVISWWNYTIADGIEYYIYDDWLPPQRDLFGLELSNAAGQMVFSSAWHRLKVLDRYNVGQWATGIGGYYDVPLVNHGRRMGVLLINPRVHSLITSPETMAVLQESVCFTADTNLRVGATQLINSDGWEYTGTGWWNTTPMIFLTIDIETTPLGITLG